jgi:hypothetical protein
VQRQISLRIARVYLRICLRIGHGVIISPASGTAKTFMLRALLRTKSRSVAQNDDAQCADEESGTMNDMSVPRRAQQNKDLNEATYSTIFARTATTFRLPERILAGIAELALNIAVREDEIESERRIRLDLIETLRPIGVFRMFAPQSHGGLEFDLPGGLAVITALAKIQDSVGWTAMIGSAGGLFAPLLPRATYDQIYRDGPDVIDAGSIQPAGTAERVAGGWLVNGQWPFASGCLHADWMVGFCVMTEGGNLIPGAGGVPLIRGFFMPAHDWQIEDTW